MSDEQMQSLLDRWYRDRETPRPKVQSSVTSVMSRLPRTRQRSRWWPFPIFYRRTQSFTADDTTDYQPRPIPASNGRSPTVTGRTQSMFSPAKAITAGALVFAVGGAFLIAQPFSQQGSAPAAAIDPCATPITRVTGDITWGPELPGTEYFSVGGNQHVRGAVYVNTMDLDDDRLDGRATANLAWDISGGSTSDDSIHRGTMRIQNEGGAWEGPFTGIGQYSTLRGALFLTGSGGYEGLSAMLLQVSFAGDSAPIEGSIYPTDIASCGSSAAE